MEISNHFHAPATVTAERDTQLSMEYGVGWTPEQIWIYWKRGKSLTHTRNRITSFR